MGCTKIGHCHQWPTSGRLIIQRCEIRCNFCDGPAAFKDWKYAWFLRRHVRAVHVKSGKGKYANLRVEEAWDEKNVQGIKPEPRDSDDEMDGMGTLFEPIEWVQQPIFDEQRVGQQMPAGFSTGQTLEERTIDPANAQVYQTDPVEMSINDISFANEHQEVLPNHRHNTLEHIRGWLSEMAGGDFEDEDAQDVEDIEGIEGDAGDAGDAVNVAGVGFAENDMIDPRLIQPGYQYGIGEAQGGMFLNRNDSVTNLDSTANSFPATPGHKGKNRKSDPAAYKYFMGDYDESPTDQDLDDLPLQQVFNGNLHAEQPSFDELWPMFDKVHQTTEQLQSQGIDMNTMQYVYPYMNMFAHSLQENT